MDPANTKDVELARNLRVFAESWLMIKPWKICL